MRHDFTSANKTVAINPLMQGGVEIKWHVQINARSCNKLGIPKLARATMCRFL